MKESKKAAYTKQFYLRFTLIMLLFALTFSFCVNTRAKGRTPAQTSAAAARAREIQRRRNLRRFYAVCTNIQKIMAKKGFRYSNGGVAKSFRKALKKGKKRCNCARYISWCLQEYGAISQGKTFYAEAGGGIHKSFRSWGRNVIIRRVYRSPSSAGLREGDVCFWDGVPHVCIYAGKNSRGKTLWFDGGKVATRSNSEGSPYKKYGRRHLGYLDHRTVSYVIRIKNLQ